MSINRIYLKLGAFKYIYSLCVSNVLIRQKCNAFRMHFIHRNALASSLNVTMATDSRIMTTLVIFEKNPGRYPVIEYC